MNITILEKVIKEKNICKPGIAVICVNVNKFNSGLIGFLLIFQSINVLIWIHFNNYTATFYDCGIVFNNL